ncbi:hypothetical protein Mgra_00000283 [Meloidogyne graminicola]|uniref:Macro domain-containing protein n=1 Tax=Meloidogyne graminicola TaxID=189291 RepID=A0A8T0A4I9_9BILA|nr:hypothetical protein Mgra_00000283 [Meloidogyne graminicola]
MSSSQPKFEKRSLFKEKVVVCREAFESVKADAFINLCGPDILTGMGYFERIHQLAGPELAEECAKYVGACPTSSRVTPSFEANNFKVIVHTIVPLPIDLNRLIDLKKVYLSATNSLNMAMEEGAKTIAFPPYFPGLSCNVASELLLRIFTIWIHRNQYSDQLKEMKICCQDENEFYYFVQAARSLYEEASLIGHMFVPEFLQQRSNYYRRLNRPRRSRRTFEHPPPIDAPRVKLELSAKLAPTILVIDDENGLKRQYRLTNKSRDGRKMYFRCSRCDTLIKKDGVQIRAKLIVEDGQIVSERNPQHHPECEAKPIEQVLIQQVDRTSRREVKDLYLLPQDAYKKALDRMNFEAKQLGLSVEECFPEWPKLRQQYCRLRKQAVMQKQQERLEFMINNGEIVDEEDLDPLYLRYRNFQGSRKRGRPRKDDLYTDEFLIPPPIYSPTELNNKNGANDVSNEGKATKRKWT